MSFNLNKSNTAGPLWNNVATKLQKAVWPAAAVRKTAGLSYRQIKYLDQQKYVSMERDSEKDWRKFTGPEIFALLAGSRLMDMGIPPKKLKGAIDFFTKANLLDRAVSALADKKPCLISANLQGTYVFGVVEGDLMKEKPFIVLDLIPLAKIFLNIVELSVPAMEISTYNYLMFTIQEKYLIGLVRSKKYDEITIKQLEDNLKIFGKKYINKDVSNEIRKRKISGKRVKVTTFQDENGKLTSAQIEEDLSQKP